MANEPHWVRENKIKILVQIGREKERGFEQVPLARDFAKDQTSRDMLQVFSDVIALGRPYLAPPGVPAERITALRAAFDAAMKDLGLIADAERARLEFAPTRGVVLQDVVKGMFKTNAEVLAHVKAVLEASGAGDKKPRKLI